MVEKDKVYLIPPPTAGFKFTVKGPAGENYVKAIATLKKPGCVKQEFLEAKGAFFDVKEPIKAIKDIEVELRRVDAKTWAEANTSITILAKAKPAPAAYHPLKPVGEVKPPAAQPVKPGGEAKPPAAQPARRPTNEQKNRVKDIVAEERKIKNDKKPFNIKLSLADNKSQFAVGDPVGFEFQSGRDCYLTLIDIGTSGRVHRLFPNRFHKSNKVEKGKTYRIPPKDSGFVFKAKGPVGTEYVKAIATLEPVQSIAQADPVAKGAFPEIKKPKLVLKDIGVELAKRDGKSWTEAELSFKIVPAAARPVKPVAIRLSTDKRVYKIGEPIVFQFQADKDCELTLIDIGSSGKVRVIFPNRYCRNNSIKANKVYQLPPPETAAGFAYKVIGPPGSNTIKAIAVIRPCDCLPKNVSFEKDVYPMLGDKDKVLKDIRIELAKIKPANYCETDVTIEIR